MPAPTTCACRRCWPSGGRGRSSSGDSWPRPWSGPALAAKSTRRDVHKAWLVMSVARIDGKILPILPARNVDETIRFYARLGFAVVGRFGGKRRYLVLVRDDAELHFFLFPSVDPRTNLSGCY